MSCAVSSGPRRAVMAQRWVMEQVAEVNWLCTMSAALAISVGAAR